MTRQPSPEKPLAKITDKAYRIRSRDVARLVAVGQRVSALDFSSIPFDGYNKFSGQPFRYAIEHLIVSGDLYFIGGKPEILNSPVVVSFCGSETPTIRGFQLAELLAQLVSEVGLVVSGGVHGVDMAAHLGALDGGGPTIAVVANSAVSGLHPYVPRRQFIESGILGSGGGILSEYSNDVVDRRERLLARDRIISALSDVMVVIEASVNSASVDTAKRAHLQGKTVLAVNWSRFPSVDIDRPKTSGIAQLIALGIAEPFPDCSVGDLADPLLTSSFVNRITKICAANVRPTPP
jgi:hypothetical protein